MKKTSRKKAELELVGPHPKFTKKELLELKDYALRRIHLSLISDRKPLLAFVVLVNKVKHLLDHKGNVHAELKHWSKPPREKHDA